MTLFTFSLKAEHRPIIYVTVHQQNRIISLIQFSILHLKHLPSGSGVVREGLAVRSLASLVAPDGQASALHDSMKR